MRSSRTAGLDGSRSKLRRMIAHTLRNIVLRGVIWIVIGTASPAGADEALDRCRALTIGMTTEAVAALLGVPVRQDAYTFQQNEINVSCLVYLTLKRRVWQIKLSTGLGLKPMSEQQFNDIVRQRTKKWGAPTGQHYRPERAVAGWYTTGDTYKYILMIWFGEDFALYEEITDRSLYKQNNWNSEKKETIK